MICMSKNINYDEAKQQVISVLDNKMALNKFHELINFQGGIIKDFYNQKTPKNIVKLYSKNKGYILTMDTAKIGEISHKLGRIDRNSIDYMAGIIVNKKIGDYVEENSLLATFFTNINEYDDLILDYMNSLTYGQNIIDRPQLIKKIIK